jgi:leader peptidase (prepilin peptidase)/N-methyltransferase
MTIDILIALIIGLAAGLLVNYLGDVLPATRQLTKPVCNNCKQAFNWIDYILFSACKKCHQKRPWRNLVVMVLMTILAGLLWVFPPAIGFWVGMLVAIYFGLVIVIDFEHRLVMHPVSIAGVLIGLVLGTWQHGLLNTILGCAAGFLLMLALYYLGVGFVRFLSKKKEMPGVDEALGFGDVILSGVMGLFLGWPGVIAGLVLMIVLGGLVSLVILIIQVARHSYKAYSAIPYAPFIALSAMALLLLARS